MVSRPYNDPTDDNPEWTEEMFAKARPGREVLPPEVLAAPRAAGRPDEHFEIYEVGGAWRWRLRAANGEVVAVGESYRTRADCELAIDVVRKTSPDTPIERVDAA